MHKIRMFPILPTLATLFLVGISSSVSAAVPSISNLNCDVLDELAALDDCTEVESQIFIEKNGLGVQLPEPGSSSEIVVDYVDGSSQNLTVSRGDNGSLSFKTGVNAAGSYVQTPEKLVTGLSSSNCGSPFHFIFSGKKPSQIYNWWYRPAGQPNSNSLSRIGESFITWKSGVNRCNSTIIPNNYETNYEGNSTLSLPIVMDMDVSPSPICVTPASQKDLVGWTWMSSDILGVACKTSLNQSTGSYRVSLAFNTNSTIDWYAGFDPLGCTGNKYDLKGVATHEVGHSLGLSHISHSGQVMKYSAGPCEIDMRGLGYGDVHGVATIYPN